MRKFNQLAALALCVGISAAVLSACTPGHTDDTPTIKPTIERTIDALRTQDVESVTLDVSADLQATMPGNTAPEPLGLKLSGKANLSDGDGDAVIQRIRDGKTDYRYGYLRDWQTFYTPDYVETAAAGEATYKADGDFLEIFNLRRYFDGTAGTYENFIVKYLQYAANLLRFDLRGLDEESCLKADINLFNAGMLAFCDAAGGVNEGEETLNIDLHRVVKTLKTDLETVVTGIDENTTVKDILCDDTIKKYAESLTRTIRVEDVPNLLLKAFNEVKKDFDDFINPEELQKLAALIAIKPNVSSTAYEYAVKLVTSDEAEYLLRSLYNTDVDFDRKLWEQEQADNWEDFYTNKIEYVLRTLDMVAADDDFSGYTNGWQDIRNGMRKLEFKGVTWTYTPDEDGTVAVLDVGGEVTFETDDGCYTGNVTARMTFSGVKIILDDAGGYTIEKRQYAPIPDGKSEEPLEIRGEFAQFYVYPIFKDDNVTGFSVSLPDGGGENTVAYDRGQKELTLTVGEYSITVTVIVSGEGGWTDSGGNYYADNRSCSIMMQNDASGAYDSTTIERADKTAVSSISEYLTILGSE